MTETSPNCIKKTDNGIFLMIRLTPNSSKDEFIGYCDEYIKIKVSAPPNENKANKKLLSFLSETFKLSKSSVELVSGDKSRLKKILLKNIDEENVKQKIFLYDKIST